MKVIIISGTPGTGKTKISNYISKTVNANVISLSKLALSENLIFGYDEKRDTSIINKKRLLKRVNMLIKKYRKARTEFLIIESHFTDIIPSRLIDFAIVLRCDPDELFKRLKIRGYNQQKIIENVQSEILGESANYLINKKLSNPVIEINTTNKEIEDTSNIIIDFITEKLETEQYQIGKIDWLEKLNIENRLEEYFN